MTAELDDSQARLAGIVRSVKDAIVTVDAAHKVVLFNPAAEVMFGLTADMVIGQPLERLIPQRFRELHSGHIHNFSETGVTMRSMGAPSSLFGLRATGEEFPIEASISQVEFGGEKYFTAVVRDVTERVRQEQALANSRAQLAGVVGSAMDAIITINESQQITLYNAAAERMFGYRAEAMIGQPLELLIPERYRVAHGHHIRHFGQTGTTSRHMDGLNELMGVRANGEEFPIEASISQVAIEGRHLFTVIVRDISERHRAAEALRQSEAQYKAIVETSLEGIWMINAERLTTYVNPRMAEMLETTPEEMRGRPLSDFMTPEDFEVAAQKIAEQLTHGARHQIDVRFRRVDGSFIYCLLAGNAILDQDGKFVGSLAMCMDITDRKRAQEERAKMEEQFLQAQKMEAIGTLAGGIAHDFNNILAAIQGYGEMVLNNLAPGSQDYQDQQEVLQAAERAIQLVRQILTFSRKTKSKRVLVSLPVMVQEVCKLMHASLPATIEVRQALEEREANVIADPIEIHQILVNLCTNAGYSMQDSGGRLMIKLRRHKVDGTGSYGVELEPGDYYVLSVSDTGCGIPEEILSRIFEPFFTTKGAGEGTGLGLSTVHGVAKALGGRVSVYSEVGKGTTFNVYLPSADGGHTEVVKQEVTTGTERILFVDDEAPLVRLGKHILEDLGYSVVALADSTQALEIFEAAPGDFDLVVTDETMPKLKGSDLARRIAEIRPDLPVILCTGYGQELSGLPDSVGTVLHKPVSRTELSHAIREVLEKNPRP